MKIEENKIILTEEAKEIFGDIVEYAYMNKSRIGSEEGFRDMAERAAKTKGEIELEEYYPVFIKLKNGKSFLISTSEWGFIEGMSEEEFLDKL